MTHDLIKNILESLEARVVKIVVNDLRDNTFYAVIHLQLGARDLTVDSRPSDAIALALRVGAPIFVDDAVLAKAESVEVKVVKDTEGRRQGRRPGQDQGVARVAQAGRLRQARARQGPEPPRTSRGVNARRTVHEQLPAVPRRRHDRRRDAAAGA